jgi:hypothetical protein
MGDLFGSGDYERRVAEEQAREAQRQTERLRTQAEGEKRDLLEKQQAGLKARQRGGARALLSDERVDGEQGVEDLKDTLGTTGGV